MCARYIVQTGCVSHCSNLLLDRKTASLALLKEKQLFRLKKTCLLRHRSGILRRTVLFNTPENLYRSTSLPFVQLEVIRGALYL